MTRFEYRLTIKRKDCPPKVRVYRSKRAVDVRLILLGPEPWKAHRKDPDALHCCNGRECGCRGETVREYEQGRRADLPALESVRVERREVEVGPWREQA